MQRLELPVVRLLIGTLLAMIAWGPPRACRGQGGDMERQAAQGDFGPPVHASSSIFLPNASVPLPPAAPNNPSRPSAWPSDTPADRGVLPSPQPSPPNGASISQIPYTNPTMASAANPAAGGYPSPSAPGYATAGGYANPSGAGSAYPSTGMGSYTPSPTSAAGAPAAGVQPGPTSGAPAGASPAPPAETPPNPAFTSAGTERGGTTAIRPGDRSLIDASAKPCEGTEILARVGTEVIMACDVLSEANEEIDKALSKVPAEQRAAIPPEQLEMARTAFVQKAVRERVETKIVYLDAQREIPAEGLAGVEKRVEEIFDSSELEKLLKRYNVRNREELDAKYRSMGTSLERQERSFVEKTLAHQWIREKVKFEGEIAPDEMLEYYRKNGADFDHPAQARWEELMARTAKYESRDQAYTAIVQMGNEVLRGKPLADVAKARSDGATAAKGGAYDWTTQGSLASTELDQALFGLPVGQLSQIIESPRGFHIVRVVERKDAYRTPFLEAQVKIREKIRDLKTKEQLAAYLQKLQNRIPTWTVYDAQQNPPAQQAQRANQGAPLPR